MAAPAFVLQLQKPIEVLATKGGGFESRSVIEFREPTGGDLFDLGEPQAVERTVHQSDGGTRSVTLRIVRNQAAIKQYLSRLSGLPGVDIGQLSVRDTLRAADWLCDVAFGQDAEKSPSPPPSAS